MTNPRDAALKYAARGWPVFPCSAETRAPLLPCDKDEQGREIRRTGGVMKASTDPDLVAGWWTRWPTAMIAAAAGSPIGAFVVDVDVKTDDGRAVLAAKEDEHGQLPETWEALTPSGGLHLYFAMPDRPLRNRVGFLPGLDVRTDGGSITLPPSRRGDGVYRWTRRPSETALAFCPAWLLELIAPPEPPRRIYVPDFSISDRYARAALNAECADLAAMKPNTGRNQRLFVAAARLGELVASRALHASTVEGALETAAISCGLHMDDGGMRGVQSTIASGIAKGVQQPRAKKPDVTPQMRELMNRREQSDNEGRK